MTHFLKHLTQDTITLKKLLLPAKFVTKCGRGNLTNPVVLEPTVGDPREVELYEDGDGFWLRNGWQEFVVDCKVSHGCYLLFEYKSYSRFKLVMLGANGLDLVSPIPKRDHFLKHVTEDTITLKKLFISPQFVMKCGRGNLTNPVVLEPTVGDPREVELSEDNSGFWLRNGWQEFVNQYSLSHGHYLVFEYKSYSRFKLVMLGANGMELEFVEAEEEEKTVNTNSVEFIGTSWVKDSHNSNNNGGAGRQQAKLQSGNIRTTDVRGKRKANWALRNRGGNRIPFGSDDAENSQPPSMEGEPVAKRPSSYHTVESNENQDFMESAEEEDYVDASYVEFLGSTFVKEMMDDYGGGVRQPPQPRSAETTKQKKFMSARKRRRANGGEKRKVNQEVPKTYRDNGSPFGSDNAETSHIPSMAEQEAIPEPRMGNVPTSSVNPSFTITISQYYMEQSLIYVPIDFVLKHMELENSTMMVYGEDGLGPWSLSFVFRPAHKCETGRRGRGLFRGGFRAFNRDNSLKPGDVCRFEFISRKEMEVTIQRN